MFGDWWVQQGVPGPQLERRPILRNESNAKKIHIEHPKIINNLELKKHFLPTKPSVHRKIKPCIRNHKLRVPSPRL